MDLGLLFGRKLDDITFWWMHEDLTMNRAQLWKVLPGKVQVTHDNNWWAIFVFCSSNSLDLDAPPCKCSLDFGHTTHPNLAHLLDASGPRIMEYQLTTPKDKFDARFRQKEAKPIDFEKEGLAYRALVNHCAWNLEPQNLKSCRAAWG